VPVGVVIVHWAHASRTAEAVRSALASVPPVRHVVVVDNGSADGSGAAVARALAADGLRVAVVGERDLVDTPPATGRHEVVIIRSRTNRGYAGGGNLGAAWCWRDPVVTHVAVCNNDLVVSPAYVGAVHAAMVAEGAELASGVLRHADAPDRVWYAGGRIELHRGDTPHDTRVPADGRPFATGFVTGAAMLIARTLVQRIGPLPEAYAPGYYEDAEYSVRAVRAGARLLVVPAAEAWHAVGASFGDAHRDLAHQRRVITRQLWFVRRNAAGLARWRALWRLSCRHVQRGIGALLRADTARARAVLGGWFDGVAGDCGRAGA
jgi:GT2 family glycosyltransferase